MLTKLSPERPGINLKSMLLPVPIPYARAIVSLIILIIIIGNHNDKIK